MTSPENALARGTLLSVALRWFVKGIGLVSTIVLARFLLPSDYGVLVMATLVIGLVEIFIFSGADAALLRYPETSDDLVNSAWTLRLIQSFIVAATVAILTPFAANYFRDDRVMPVMFVLSIGIVINALSNIGPVLARKNLNFGLEVKIGVISKLASFVVTVVFAYFSRNYWALVVGTIVGQLVTVFCSYKFHSYRPRWVTSRIRELWSFSQWLLISSVGNYFGRKLDELILGRIGTSKDLGVYNVGSEIGQVVTVEISAPFNRSLYPVLSSIQSDRPKSLELFFSTLGIVNTLTIPVGIGMCILASSFVQVVLGYKWIDVAPILEVFALQGVIRFLVSPYYVWFMVIDKGRVLASMSWLELLIFLVFAWILHGYSAIGLAWARLLTTVLVVMVWILVGRAEGLKPRLLLSSVYRPVFAGIGMAAVLLQCRAAITFADPYRELFILSAVGAISYTTLLIGLWIFSGRPAGLEKSILSRFSK